MRKKYIIGTMIFSLVLTSFCGCSFKKESEDNIASLDPDNPVSLTIWHYYNGTQQAMFDELLEEFNASVGKEKGIYVEGYSQGSVNDLEKAVSSAIKGEVGAKDLPDIFSSYVDTAYSAQKKGMLADLSQYFSDDEISEYVDSYMREGYFNDDDALYLMPVAKSTEIMMINTTDWKTFADATGTTLDELSTTQGITKVAKKYYEWTDGLTPDVPDDGKAFYGRDSMSNYFIIGMKQMGKEIFEVENGKVKINTDKELIKTLWDNYYIPYINGYFKSYGKFRSDDVRTGDILAYTGSTSSTFYFPDNVENEKGLYPIEFEVLQAPVMENGEKYLVQQGAGMAVTKSDKEHEYAASIFLKWFTSKENNMRFVCESGYLPVLKEANTIEALDEVVNDNKLDMNKKAYKCIKTVLNDFNDTKFYTTKSFENGYSARMVLDYNLSDRAIQDKKAIDDAVAAGASRQEEIKKYSSDESFESWYKDFCNALNDAIK